MVSLGGNAEAGVKGCHKRGGERVGGRGSGCRGRFEARAAFSRRQGTFEPRLERGRRPSESLGIGGGARWEEEGRARSAAGGGTSRKRCVVRDEVRCRLEKRRERWNRSAARPNEQDRAASGEWARAGTSGKGRKTKARLPGGCHSAGGRVDAGRRATGASAQRRGAKVAGTPRGRGGEEAGSRWERM